MGTVQHFYVAGRAYDQVGRDADRFPDPVVRVRRIREALEFAMRAFRSHERSVAKLVVRADALLEAMELELLRERSSIGEGPEPTLSSPGGESWLSGPSAGRM